MADKETKHGTLLDPLALGDLFGIQREPDEVHYKSPLSVLKEALETGGVAELIGLGGSGGSATLEVTQANTFSVGDAVNIRTGGLGWWLADADNSRPCHALVLAATAADFTAQASGFMTWTGHGLLVGVTYYLSTTPGGVVTPKPGLPGQIIQRILVVVDANTIKVTIGEAWT